MFRRCRNFLLFVLIALPPLVACMSGGHRDPEKIAMTRYMVSIRTQSPTRFFGDNHFCAGSIVGPGTVLTAAHCIMDKRMVLTRPRRLLIVAGAPKRLQRQPETKQYKVKRLLAHPNYIRDNTNDIAIIRIEGTFPEDNPFIAIIPLPIVAPPFGKRCTTIGWGRLYFNGPLSDATVHVDLDLMAPDNCKVLTQEFKQGTFCAGDQVLWNEDPCRGDSGGPMICDGQLTGIISWTIGCGSKTVPSLYTDVFDHLEWIGMHMNGGLNIAASSLLVLPLCLAAIMLFDL